MTIDLAAAPAPLWLRIARNPLTRIVLFVAMFAAFHLALRGLIPPSGLSTEASLALRPGDPILWLGALRNLVPAALAYWLLVRLIEGRRVEELNPRKSLTYGLGGWLVGAVIMLSTAGAMALFGAYSVVGIDSGVNWVAPLLIIGLLPGITEEIIFRGVLFRVVEDAFGTWIALILSALVFGLLHWGNPNATWWSSFAIAVEAGLLLGMAYACTRSLWFVMGLHAAWNFTQGVVLGIPVSGFALKGFLASTTQGSVWLSGGEFGAEASVLAVMMCLIVAYLFTRKAIATKRIRAPFWRRSTVA